MISILILFADFENFDFVNRCTNQRIHFFRRRSMSESDSFLFHTKVKVSGKKSKLVQEFIDREKEKQPSPKTHDFDIHDFISSQEPLESSIEKLEKQSHYLKEIRLAVIPEQYYKIENSLK